MLSFNPHADRSHKNLTCMTIFLLFQDHSQWITSGELSYLSNLQTAGMSPLKRFSPFRESLPS